ncbi:MAG: hypothetical protein JXA20_19355 [Spirochaetes bacterium]|nr:hypothetical protein [Spirochaetota bacterium]
MHNKTIQRVSIINQDASPIIKIKRQHAVYILKSGAAGFALGITFSLFIGLLVSMVVLKSLLKMDTDLSVIVMFAIMLLGGFIVAYRFIKSEKDLSPFYFQVEGDWYTLWWHNKEKQARKGKHANLHIQITMLEDKTSNYLRLTSKDKTVYETEHLTSEDIAQIRGYLKKRNVTMPQ